VRVVLLAGGLGTRLAEETDRLPKPMVEIGGRPMLWHIMKTYERAGLRHFVVALGYKGEAVKRFFIDHRWRSADLTVHTGTGEVEVRDGADDDWRVDLVETGLTTNTGGRLLRLRDWLPDDEFCLTYGDGLCTVDLAQLIAFHRSHGRAATVTAIRPPSRFGGLILDGDSVTEFTEKPQIGEGWINGGYMVLSRSVLDRIGGDDASLESDVLEELAAEDQLRAYRHEGFWQPMDTLRDVRLLQDLWDRGVAPWQGLP
jgi:glucose-1-phosphate cytidylyltransferase